MGEPSKIVHAELIFMMAILDPKEQIETLKKVLNVFQDDNAFREFKIATDNMELYKVAKKYLDWIVEGVKIIWKKQGFYLFVDQALLVLQW